MSKRTTRPVYECLPVKQILALILYQWETYGLKLELLDDVYKDIEDRKEIDQLMREPSKRRRAGA